MANMTFNANLLPKTDLGFDLGSSDQRWNIYGNIQGQAKIFYGTCATPAGTEEKVVVCPSFTAADLQPGTTIMVKFDNTNSAAVANIALNVNNTGALHINRLGNATFNDLPAVGYLIANHVYRFYYSYNASAQPRWTVDLYYDTNSNSVGYDNRQYYGAAYKAYSKVYRYMLLFEKSRGILVPTNSTSNSTATNKTLTTEEFNPFGKIFYYNTTTAIEANAAFGNNTLAEWVYFNLAYSFNTGSTLTIGSPVYIVCAPQSNGMVKLHSAPISQTLPSSADNLYYIYLGQAYTTSSVSMTNIHPVYTYINGKVREIHDDSLTVNGHTVAVDVPSGAKFTDTTYTFEDGINGFKVTPSGGTTQTVNVTPSIINNITGSGTNGYLAKFNGANTITNGPQLGSSTTTFLRNDGTWVTPTNTDTLVKQTVKTDNVNYKLLATTSASPSSGTAMEATYSDNIFINPSTGTISAVRHSWNVNGTEKAYTTYNSTTDAIDFIFV